MKAAGFICAACGAGAAKWQGQCAACGAWNTLTEARSAAAGAARAPVATPLAEIAGGVETARFSSGVAEFDRVLGGGFVPGGVVLLGGAPGVGKSTLLLQIAAAVGQHLSEDDALNPSAPKTAAGRVGSARGVGNARSGDDARGIGGALYISGEESVAQIALRARRLNIGGDNVRVLAANRAEEIAAAIEQARPALAIVDSIQTARADSLTAAAAGGALQVRESAMLLAAAAKRAEVALVLVGHVTKDGALAGPRVLEHIVDAVLYFEGDPDSPARIVRAAKNRYGAVHEMAAFAMGARGMAEVKNPSALFLSRRARAAAGAAVTVAQEGSRPLLVEIQALVGEPGEGPGRRAAVGLDAERAGVILAALARHAAIHTRGREIYINAVGGARVHEPAADLACAFAVVSSLYDRPLPEDLAVFGEVGLTGEIRQVPHGLTRIREALKLGFRRVVAPRANLPRGVDSPHRRETKSGAQIVGVASLADAVGILRDEFSRADQKEPATVAGNDAD